MIRNQTFVATAAVFLVLAGCGPSKEQIRISELEDEVASLSSRVTQQSEALEKAKVEIANARSAIDQAQECDEDAASEASSSLDDAEAALEEVEE